MRSKITPTRPVQDVRSPCSTGWRRAGALPKMLQRARTAGLAKETLMGRNTRDHVAAIIALGG
jgi:hypothetical protein